MSPDSHLKKQVTPRHIVKPKKSLGQNFLVDKRVLYRIVSATGVSPCDTVVEIGAGRGELTRLLADRAARVIALEIDETLLTNLKDRFQNKQNISGISQSSMSAYFIFPVIDLNIGSMWVTYDWKKFTEYSALAL